MRRYALPNNCQHLQEAVAALMQVDLHYLLQLLLELSQRLGAM
jgi:hypothetical protein